MDSTRTAEAKRIVFLSSLISLWSAFFLIGVFIDTTPMQHRIETLKFYENSPFNFISDLIIMITCWTWCNLIFICCLASIVGEHGRATTLSKSAAANHRTAIIRGFFVYLLVLTGQLVVSGSFGPTAGFTDGSPVAGPDNLVSLDIAHYFRLAGFASLVSFMAGYDPKFLANMVNKLEKISGGQIEEAPPHSEHGRE